MTAGIPTYMIDSGKALPRRLRVEGVSDHSNPKSGKCVVAP
jgi:hypothetical protein